jgi:hypothetical protein
MFPLAHLSPSFHARSFIFYLLSPVQSTAPLCFSARLCTSRHHS